MSLQITDDTHVALFENTGDWAFGPIFGSRAEAEDFLDWYEARSRVRFDALMPDDQREQYEQWRKEQPE
jgi:hypothetical protein